MTAEQIEAIAAVVTALAWPAFAAFALSIFREPLQGLITRSKQLTVKFFGHEVTVQADSQGRDIEELLKEVQDTVSGLSEEHRQIFFEINSADGRRTVGDYFGGFERDTNSHLLLQELRDRKLIRPTEGGSWRAEKRPVVTRFARLVLRLCPECLAPTGRPNQVLLHNRGSKDASRDSAPQIPAKLGEMTVQTRANATDAER